jgi:hypothetical protein
VKGLNMPAAALFAAMVAAFDGWWGYEPPPVAVVVAPEMTVVDMIVVYAAAAGVWGVAGRLLAWLSPTRRAAAAESRLCHRMEALAVVVNLINAKCDHTQRCVGEFSTIVGAMMTDLNSRTVNERAPLTMATVATAWVTPSPQPSAWKPAAH